jgi:hypothetical protein
MSQLVEGSMRKDEVKALSPISGRRTIELRATPYALAVVTA